MTIVGFALSLRKATEGPSGTLFIPPSFTLILFHAVNITPKIKYQWQLYVLQAHIGIVLRSGTVTLVAFEALGCNTSLRNVNGGQNLESLRNWQHSLQSFRELVTSVTTHCAKNSLFNSRVDVCSSFGQNSNNESREKSMFLLVCITRSFQLLHNNEHILRCIENCTNCGYAALRSLIYIRRFFITACDPWKYTDFKFSL